MTEHKSFTTISQLPLRQAETNFESRNVTPLIKRLLYIIPRYARDLMGNQIHTEVIHWWQRQQIHVDLLCFDANTSRETFELLDNIPVYRLPISQSFATKAVNRAVNPLIHYPYFPGLLRAYRHFLSQHQYDFAHVETAFPLGVVERRQRSLDVSLEFGAGLAFTLGSLEMPLDVVEVVLQLLRGHARSMTRGCNAVRRTRDLAAPWGSW